MFEKYGIILFLIDDFSVNLRHSHRCMTEQLRYGIEVCTKRQHHGRERMPEPVESDRLRKEKQTEED